MSTIEAEVEFYFVKSHFAKESSIAKDAGLSNSNPVENYVVLLKRSLEIHNIKILDIKGQYISQGVGKKCSVTTQRIRFPSELRNQIQEKLISILHEANLNSISRKDVGDIAVVKKIFDDNNIQHIQNIQNQQAQKNKYVPPQILPQNPLQQQQYQNNFSHNNFQHNGQQIVQSQNNNQPISYNTNQAQQQHYQQVPQNYIQQNNQEAQAKAQMNKLQNHNNYQQNANPQSQAQQYQSLPQSLQQYQGIPDFETRTNSSIESDSSQMVNLKGKSKKIKQLKIVAQTVMEGAQNQKIVNKTRGILAEVGRAIAVDLSDSNLPHDQGIKPHMTVVFSREHFTQEDINELYSLEQQFRKSQGLQQNDNYSFILENWGPRSKEIQGQLYDLCVYLRQHFTGNSTDERVPHVELKKLERKRK
ncbi:hypothetical protein ABPG72_015227 [Tetrahymena utriculariae]